MKYTASNRYLEQSGEITSDDIPTGSIVKQSGYGWGRVVAKTATYVAVVFPSIGLKSYHPQVFLRENIEYILIESIVQSSLEPGAAAALEYSESYATDPAIDRVGLGREGPRINTPRHKPSR